MSATPNPEEVLIRLAVLGDETKIATAHIASWRSSYRGIIPAQVLDNLSVERSAAYWGRQLEANGPGMVFVAEVLAGVVGFISGGLFRPDQAPSQMSGQYDCELYAIYLIETFKRRGIGRKLFEKLAQAFARNGRRAMVLWVLSENAPARRFYEKMGGRLVGKKVEAFGGKELKEIAYAWDLPAWESSLVMGNS
jgi:ribosomal protein S18 acetylase RimI-like enzyme